MRALLLGRALKPTVFVLSLLPAAWCGWQIYLAFSGMPNDLGADPAKVIVHFNGEWALRFLILTLAVTPLRQGFGLAELARLRRMLGLFTFFYALLHLAAYCVFLLELQFADIGADIVKRPYITLGFAAFVLLVPLAITSNKLAIRKLKRRWQQLHRLVYLVAVLAAAHVIWLAKSDYTEAFVYSAILGALLLFRPIKQGVFKPRSVTLENT